MPTDTLVQLSQAGIIGVMMALIMLCGYLAWLHYKVTSNHINHSNECFDNNTKALTELKGAIYSNTKATEVLSKEVRNNK